MNDMSKELRGMKKYSQQGQGEDAGMMENGDAFLWGQALDTEKGRASEKAGNGDSGPIAKIQSCRVTWQLIWKVIWYDAGRGARLSRGGTLFKRCERLTVMAVGWLGMVGERLEGCETIKY